MSLGMIVLGVTILWAISEIVLGIATRARGGAAMDRGSLGVLWIVIILGVGAGVYLLFVPIGQIRISVTVLQAIALTLMVLGLTIRWTAIITLGRFFTSKVSIQDEHAIIRTGLYRSIRHPSYSGLLVTFLGLGVSFGSWLSMAVTIIPVTIALLYRVRVEEGVLHDALGKDYADYCATTKRLIPGIY